MKTRVIISLLIVFLLTAALGSDNVYAMHPLYYNICGVNAYNIASQLITKDFSGVLIIDYSIEAVNDIQCVEPDYMANILIVFRGLTENYYGIFHVHFLPDNKLKSAAAFVPWKKHSELGEWKENWCNIIRSVYPHEIYAQGCQ